MGRPPKKDTVETEILNDLQEAIKEDEQNQAEQSQTAVLIPEQTSPYWSDYVLGLFEDNEVMIQRNKNKEEVGRYPKVNGLRRLSRLLIGEIIKSKPEVISVNYNLSENMVACAYMYTIVFDFGTDKFGNRSTKEYSDVGEVLYCDNSKLSNNAVLFAKFPSAVAATRAEARALRKALGLNVIAAEEFDRSAVPEEQEVKYISDLQKAGITNFCKRLGVDVLKYIDVGVWFGDKDTPIPYCYKDLSKVQFSDGSRMWKQLEAFQRDTKGLVAYIDKYKVGVTPL